MLRGVPNQIVERSGEIHGVLAGAAADFQHLGAAGKADSHISRMGSLLRSQAAEKGSTGTSILGVLDRNILPVDRTLVTVAPRLV